MSMGATPPTPTPIGPASSPRYVIPQGPPPPPARGWPTTDDRTAFFLDSVESTHPRVPEWIQPGRSLAIHLSDLEDGISRQPADA